MNSFWILVGLSPDQAASGRFVGSDLGPNSLQKLSADDTSRLKYVVYQSNWFESQVFRCLVSIGKWKWYWKIHIYNQARKGQIERHSRINSNNERKENQKWCLLLYNLWLTKQVSYQNCCCIYTKELYSCKNMYMHHSIVFNPLQLWFGLKLLCSNTLVRTEMKAYHDTALI